MIHIICIYKKKLSQLYVFALASFAARNIKANQCC